MKTIKMSWVLMLLCSGVVMAAGTMGTDFSKTAWDAGWASDFDNTQGDCNLTPLSYGLAVGWYGNPPVTDLELEKRYVRAAGDSAYYDAVVRAGAYGWHRGTNIQRIKTSLDSGATWQEQSMSTVPVYVVTYASATTALNPSVTDFSVKATYDDIGDHTYGLSGGGFQVRDYDVDFKELALAVPGTSFTDTLDDTSKLYSYNGITAGTVFSAPCQKIYSNSAENYMQWGFARPEGYTGPLSASIGAEVYAETYNAGVEELAISYSFDNMNWTTLDVRTYTGVGWTPEIGGTVDMAGADRLYVRIGGQTYSGGSAWLGYVNNLDVEFVPEPMTMLLLGMGGLLGLRRRR